MRARPCVARQISVAAALGLLGCVPEFEARNSEVDRGRILAVVAEPAEARPGARVEYTALVVNAEGRDGSSRLSWSYCVTPRPLIGNGSVSPQCLSEPGVPLDPARSGGVAGNVPLDACSRFGPDPPPGDARPRDADETGGYYQPLRVAAFGTAWLHFERLICNPRNAPADVARELARSYTANRNPTRVTLELSQGGVLVPDAPISAGAELELVLRWAEEDAEPYVRIGPASQQLEPRREELLVSWFGTGGSFESDRTPAARDASHSENRWVAPAQAGSEVIWAVLRDSRGGTAFVERGLTVTE